MYMRNQLKKDEEWSVTNLNFVVIQRSEAARGRTKPSPLKVFWTEWRHRLRPSQRVTSKVWGNSWKTSAICPSPLGQRTLFGKLLRLFAAYEFWRKSSAATTVLRRNAYAYIGTRTTSAFSEFSLMTLHRELAARLPRLSSPLHCGYTGVGSYRCLPHPPQLKSLLPRRRCELCPLCATQCCCLHWLS